VMTVSRDRFELVLFGQPDKARTKQEGPKRLLRYSKNDLSFFFKIDAINQPLIFLEVSVMNSSSLL